MTGGVNHFPFKAAQLEGFPALYLGQGESLLFQYAFKLLRTSFMVDNLDLFLFIDRGKSQQFEDAHAVVPVPVGNHHLLDVHRIEPHFFKLSKNSIIISRIDDGQVVTCKRIDITGFSIADEKIALCKDRICYLQNLCNRQPARVIRF